MKIQAYKTNVGTFFKIADAYYGNKDLINTGLVSINGTPVGEFRREPSGWYKTDVELKQFEKRIPGKNIVSHYEIKDARLVNSNMPEIIQIEDIQVGWDDDKDVWYGKYAGLQDYYTKHYKVILESTEIVEIEVEYFQELVIENYESPVDMSIKCLRDSDRYGSGVQVDLDLSKICIYADIERMLTPEFLLHERPCSLTSKQVYRIIRSHVLNNLDRSTVKVTSNYDFCFEVKKVVSTPAYTVKAEQLTNRGNSYKPPRFSNKKTDTKNESIFEMTWDGADKGKGYGDYTVIEGWDAPNFKALAYQVKMYLDDLMKVLNSPASECKECRGCGMIFQRLNTNERE